MLCAITPNSFESEQDLYKIHNLEEFCNEQKNFEDQKCIELKKQAIKRIKIGLGTIILKLVLNPIHKFYPFLKLECERDLIYYYKKFGFELGQHPKFKFKWNVQMNGDLIPFRKFKEQYKEQLSYFMSQDSLNELNNYNLEEKISVFTDISNIDKSNINMFLELGSHTLNDFMEIIFNNNVLENLKYLSDDVSIFDIDDNYTKINKILSKMTCLNWLLDKRFKIN